MALFQPGQSGNPSGRRPGSKNVVQKGLRANIEKFVIEKFPTVWKEFDQLETHQKFYILEKLTAYILTKPREIDISLQMGKLTDEQLEQLSGYIMNNYGQNE